MERFADLIFSDVVPDRGGAPWLENPGYLVDAVNVRFTPNGYRSTYIDATAATVTATVGATALAAVGFARNTTPRHFVGTAAKIYESDDFGTTWNDNAGAAYSAVDWDFAIFGLRVIAVNISDNPQSKLLTDAVGTNFADLAGSPPKASRVARIRDNLVLGPLVDGYTLQWSSIGDPTDWPTPGGSTALARQAGSVALQSEYGLITKLVGGEKFGLIFQERAITRMTYVGGDIQYTFDVFEKGNGTGYSHSAIRIGNTTYFLNSTGVYATDGYSVTPLSLGKIDDSLILRLLSHPKQPNVGNGVAYDHRIKCICWPFTDAGGADFLLCYDIALQQFKIVDLAGTLLDGTLYSVHNGASQQNAFQVPHCIDETNKLRQFSDITDVPTTLRTGFVELAPGAITKISGIQVLGSAMSATPTISVRSEIDSSSITLTDSNYDLAEKSNLSDIFRVRKTGRFHSFKYVDTAQPKAALVRGLRVYYQVDTAR